MQSRTDLLAALNAFAASNTEPLGAALPSVDLISTEGDLLAALDNFEAIDAINLVLLIRCCNVKICRKCLC